MEAIVCQAAELNTVEATADAQTSPAVISPLTSAEMSYAGGGLMAVCFA